MEGAAADKPKRTRKTHSKVRTGCVTCKIRRKKCDETKPFCRRCTSTGRKCDGYEGGGGVESVARTKAAGTTAVKLRGRRPPPTPSDSAIDVHSPLAASGSPAAQAPDQLQMLRLWRPPMSPWFQAEVDYFCFDFFRQRSCPEFGAYFDSNVWQSFMLRACFLHPVVLLAASAVGAVHRRFELGITPEALRFCGVAVQQCRKATLRLADDAYADTPMSAEMRMVVALLLAVFETFQTNYAAASDYLTTGIKGLVSRASGLGVTTHTTTAYKSVDIGYESLHSFTDKLEAQAHRIFGSSTTLLSRPSLTRDSVPSDPIPRTFASLEHARDVLFTEGAFVWDAWVQLELGNLPDKFSVQHRQVARLLEWSLAYAECSKTEAAPPSPSSPPPTTTTTTERASSRKNRLGPHLLKAYREALYLIILTQLAFHEPDGQVIVPLCQPAATCGYHTSCISYAERKSTLNAHLARLMVLSEPLFDLEPAAAAACQPASPSSSLSPGPQPAPPPSYDAHDSLYMDSGIGPPLFARAGHSQSTSTRARHQVTSILAGPTIADLQGQVSSRNGAGLGVYAVAERLGSIQEQAVIAAGVVGGAAEARNAHALAARAHYRSGGWMVDRARVEPRCVDITCFLEAGRLLVRSCREDEFGGLIWRSEWITF